MAKKIIVAVVLVVFILFLVLIGVRRPVMKAVPVEQFVNMSPVFSENQTVPVEGVVDDSESFDNVSDKLENILPSFNKFVPENINFFVKGVKIFHAMTERDFIPIRNNDIKEYGGSFGPYSDVFIDEWGDLFSVQICAKSTIMREVAKPNCQFVDTFFYDSFLSFALVLKPDEFIGYSALKDYEAYYIIFVGDAKAGESAHAFVRTTY